VDGENPGYSDEDVDERIVEFRAGGELAIDEDALQRLTDRQMQRLVRALEQEELNAAAAWNTAWWAGQVAEMPPSGVWTWASCPDDLLGIDGLP
jgi:hypothetical protein